MKYSQLPETEFTVMQVVWENATPISSSLVTELLKPHKDWKLQTVATLLSRLEDKGFLSSNKQGKERLYQPLITSDDYLRQETGQFIKKFHKNSITGLMSALVSNNDINDDDLRELSAWLKDCEVGGDNDG